MYSMENRAKYFDGTKASDAAKKWDLHIYAKRSTNEVDVNPVMDGVFNSWIPSLIVAKKSQITVNRYLSS